MDLPPLLDNKHTDSPSVFIPSALLREARRQKGIATAEAPPVCILDPDGDLVRWLRLSGEAKPFRNWPCYHTELDVFRSRQPLSRHRRPVRETAEAIEAARGKGILAVMARADASATIRSSSGGAMMPDRLRYLVFLPSILTTALGGRLVEQFGPRAVAACALILAALGAPALVTPKTAWFLAALARLAVETFLAQAVTTGFVGHAARADRSAAHGL
jgi:hypothetical protein